MTTDAGTQQDSDSFAETVHSAPVDERFPVITIMVKFIKEEYMKVYSSSVKFALLKAFGDPPPHIQQPL